MAKKYYAVKHGRKVGVFESWEECKANVIGYSGAVYKSFTSYEQAYEFVFGTFKEATNNQEGPCAYVDGSFDLDTMSYSYGVVLIYNGKLEKLNGLIVNSNIANMRNVAGELEGAMVAIKRALELSLDSLTIYHDYTGIAHWADGSWKTNKEGTSKYKAFYDSIKNDLDVKFIKVKAHSGIEYNEEADRLAKEALSK